MTSNQSAHSRRQALLADARKYAALLAYHPCNLSFGLREEDALEFTHPEDVTEVASPMAVGVHRLDLARNWEVEDGTEPLGVLNWHAVPLGTWVSTRAEVATLDLNEREQIAIAMPSARHGRYGTHLGLTMSTVTSDGKVVFRSRKGRYAEDSLFDSLVAGTALLEDLHGVSSTTDLLRLYLSKANISMSRDVVDFHPTHLASRICDSGLWIGGWVRLALTAADVAELVPFETASVDIDEIQALPVRLTDWGFFDLNAMMVHLEGGEMLDRLWLP